MKRPNLAKECYQAILATRENHTWIIGEEENKVETLETVTLVEDGNAKTRIGTMLSPEMRTRPSNSLKKT